MKIKENAQLIKKILMIVLASILVITSLALYIQSIESYDGGFDSNLDYVVALIISIAILSFILYTSFGKNVDYVKSKNSLLITITTVSSCYSLGVFFKGLAKGKEFQGLQVYLYFGIVTLILLIIGILNNIEKKKN